MAGTAIVSRMYTRGQGFAEGRAPDRGDLRGHDARHRLSSSPAPGSAISGTRSRNMLKASGAAWCVISAAMGFGLCLPRQAQHLALRNARRRRHARTRHAVHRGTLINLGKPHVKMLSDGWTAVTRDRSLSAQFEHTIGVTETGIEVFTYSPIGLHKPPSPAGCKLHQF